MCLLSVRTLCQEVWTCTPLRGTLSPSSCQVGSSEPRPAVFPKSGTQGLQRLYMEEVRNVMKECKVHLSGADEGRDCVGHASVTIGKHSLILFHNIPVWPLLYPQFNHHPWHLSIKNHRVTLMQQGQRHEHVEE